jgi:hypothetical protein
MIPFLKPSIHQEWTISTREWTNNHPREKWGITVTTAIGMATLLSSALGGREMSGESTSGDRRTICLSALFGCHQKGRCTPPCDLMVHRPHQAVPFPGVRCLCRCSLSVGISGSSLPNFRPYFFVSLVVCAFELRIKFNLLRWLPTNLWNISRYSCHRLAWYFRFGNSLLINRSWVSYFLFLDSVCVLRPSTLWCLTVFLGNIHPLF